ncbi:hypothetical protein SLE2022_368990 [Rubroshorea leprosula]
MTTKAAAPLGSTDGKPQTTPEPVQQVNEAQQDARPETVKQISPPSVFVNSEPIREEQVQNAVKFLSHPRVRDSPVIHRRSFLEKKGLTKEEIDEAFRRVPDPPPSLQPSSTNQDGQMKPTSNVQTQVPQPAAAAPGAVVSHVGALSPSRFHWYHALLAVGLLAASGAGTAVLIKNAIVPRLKSWIRKVVLEEEDDLVKKTNSKPSLAEEAAAAAKAAAAAATDVAKASQEMLNSRNEERRHFEELMKLLDMQVREMKSMSNSIQKLEGHVNGTGRTNSVDQEDYRFSNSISKQSYVNGKVDVDTRSVRSSSPPISVEPPAPPHPKSYMEILAMVQRGEKPPNIREIDDRPPNPSQQPSNPRFAPMPKPWELGQAQNGSNQLLQSQGVREALDYKVQVNGLNYLEDESSVPWGQKKNVRITEIANENEVKTGTSGVRTSDPVQRVWVPPQPPPVAIPEAAEAIRRPKPSAKEAVKQEELGENQSVTQSSGVTDELQRITKISESGGTVEINGGVSSLNSSEIQEEQEHSHEGN